MSAPFALSVPFILASQSPRRKKLLDGMGIPAEVRPSQGMEHIDPSLSPAEVVQRLANDKASEIAEGRPQSLVLGADTIVVLDERILGKPGDPREAREMLGQLSGRTHTVFTGIALIHLATHRSTTTFAATEVSFGGISDAEIERYVAGGSPMDKAGAYGIQDDAGALFIDGIKGDYNNVVGLPLRALYLLILSDFADLLES